MAKPSLLICLLSLFLGSSNLFAQLDDATIREKVLDDIEKETQDRARELEIQIKSLDNEIKKIDEALKSTQNTGEIIDKLKERVTTLEAIQQAQRKKELNIFSNNYQSAVINLVSMERELKPLILFNSSREFFSALTEVENPLNYPGYKSWFISFRHYIQKNKSNDAVLAVTSKLLETAGNFSQGVSIVGPLSQSLFLSIDKFINSFGKRKRDLRAKSEKMFQLTMILSQYTTDKNLIETGWDGINTELEELQKLQANTLADIFQFLGITKEEFNQKYIEETDALKRIDYLTAMRELVEQKVKSERDSKNDNWKDKIYFDMTTVQSLKIRFGNITFKIRENIERYKELIDKYKTDDMIGQKVRNLENKLDKLTTAFDAAFNPQKYVNDAVRMYKAS